MITTQKNKKIEQQITVIMSSGSLVGYFFNFFFFEQKMILSMTSQHYTRKHYNLILALQLNVKRSYATLYPEKINHRNIQITIEF